MLWFYVKLRVIAKYRGLFIFKVLHVCDLPPGTEKYNLCSTGRQPEEIRQKELPEVAKAEPH